MVLLREAVHLGLAIGNRCIVRSLRSHAEVFQLDVPDHVRDVVQVADCVTGEVAGLTGVREVRVRGMRMWGSARLPWGYQWGLPQALSCMATLRHLDLCGNMLACEGVARLVPLLPGGLETLLLNDNRVYDRGFSELCRGMPASLKRLGLSRNDVCMPDTLRELVASLPPGLEGLEFSACFGGGLNLHLTSCWSLVPGALPAGLKALDVGGNWLRQGCADGDEYYALGQAKPSLALGVPSLLTHLNVSTASFGSAREFAAALRGMPALRKLVMDRASFRDGSGAREAWCSLPVGLESLSLRCTRFLVAERACGFSLGLRRLTSLSELDLSETFAWYEDESGRQTMLFEGLPRSLRSLNLSYNDLGTGGCVALGRAMPPLLTSLDLSCCDIKVPGLLAMATEGSLSRLTALRDLDVSDNRLVGREAGVLLGRCIGGLTGLRALSLAYNRLRVAGWRALAGSLPPRLESLCISVQGMETHWEDEVLPVAPAGLQRLRVECPSFVGSGPLPSPAGRGGLVVEAWERGC